MTPDDGAQRENPFPKGYQHLEEWIQAAEGRLQQLDAELNLPDQRPALKYDPLGSKSVPQPPRRSKEVIQKEKDDLKADEYKRVEKETEPAVPDARQEMQGIAFSRLYREDIDKLRDAERGLPAYDSAWGLDRGQVKLHKLLKEHHERERATPRQRNPEAPTAPTSPGIEPNL